MSVICGLILPLVRSNEGGHACIVVVVVIRIVILPNQLGFAMPALHFRIVYNWL